MPILRTLRAATLLIMLGLLAVPSAQAEMLIKRVKCKDLENGNGVMILWNTASFNKYITVQIVRDGCRPKLGDMQISLVSATSNGSNGSVFSRLGKHTSAIYKSIDSGHSAFIRGLSISGRPVGGTFDYVLDPG